MGGVLESHNKKDLPLNILLVEDNEADVKIALRAFQQARLKNQLFVTHNGQECVDFVRHRGSFTEAARYPRPDLILLDISMPVMDGFGVLKDLKGDEALRSIPIIVMTGSSNEDDIRRSYANGANSFIRKPVAYEEFVEVVEAFNHYWHIINTLPGRKN